jgi:mannosylglycerate hydrolase
MKKIYAIAHTHWDFEWYFTRQEARVQFAFHMDEVLNALSTNQLDYYLLDGQMSIIVDYLADNPDSAPAIKRFVKAGRLFIGPWYTQIDEMTTSGEAAVHNLRLGLKAANQLGGAMPVGYLPDSFGQSQDIPKLYSGFGIHDAVFWRGLPVEKSHKFFNWVSSDGSIVKVANLTNGYSTGVPFVSGQSKEVVTGVLADPDPITILPVGSDQRPVDLNLKKTIATVNAEQPARVQVKESNYPAVFGQVASDQLPTLTGEFIDPSTSKIHRGIYSSRADLKQLYDHLERSMTYVVQPLSVQAQQFGIPIKAGTMNSVWQTIAMGQAHDSAGGCNSDLTNRDIYARGTDALEAAESLRNYLLRKMSVSLEGSHPDDGSLVFWNPLPVKVDEVREATIATTNPSFKLTINDHAVSFDLLTQKKVNAGLLTRDSQAKYDKWYYVSTIALRTRISATDWVRYEVQENTSVISPVVLTSAKEIENDAYKVIFDDGKLLLQAKHGPKKTYSLTVEDGGDEGDTYDYSPPYRDTITRFDFTGAKISTQQSATTQRLILNGHWRMAQDIHQRDTQTTDGRVDYTLTLTLLTGDESIRFKIDLDNQARDHRMRLILDGAAPATASYADTQFGTIKRPVVDPHLKDWQKVGYHEEPTSLRPMIHFANLHNTVESITFLGLGEKDFQVIGDKFDSLALTLFRGVGYLGRPDLKRRPGKASGMINKSMATPDSQLLGKMSFAGAVVISKQYNPQRLQEQYLKLTQDNLYYQNQVLDQYTTPIQFFRTNTLGKPLGHAPLVELVGNQVTLSSYAPSVDGTGCELRLYNPRTEAVSNPGKLILTKACNLTINDLAGQVIDSVASQTTTLTMQSFKPGEIRTYGIFPIQLDL